MTPNFRLALSAIAALLLLSGCADRGDDGALLLTNGRIYTLDPNNPWADSLLIDDGEIRFVGQLRDVPDHDARTLNLKERLVLPGFIDTHAHPVLGAAMLETLSLDYSDSPDIWLQQIRDYAADNPSLPFIFGLGFYAKKFGDKGPTKELLDEVVPDRPAVIIDEGGHSAWANSAALKLAGINRASPDPIPEKHYYVRTADGEPTGYAVEHLAWMPLAESIGAFDYDRMLSATENVLPIMSMFGITTIFEAGMITLTDTGHRVLGALADSGNLPVRVETSLSIVDESQLPTAIAKLKKLRTRWTSKLVNPTTIKVHNDGTTEAENSAQLTPYLNDPENLGQMILHAAQLEALLLQAADAGFHVHIHSIGERAINEALNAVAGARSRQSLGNTRIALAHTELIAPKDIPRFGDLDVIAQTTPAWFIGDDEHTVKVLGPERNARLYRFRAVIDSGGRVTFGSDFPVGGGIHALRPIVNMAVGMSRNYPGEGVAPGHAAEALTLEEMIRGYTLDAAYQLGLEEKLGSIEVGKRADLVILKRNLFEQPVEQIPDNRVYMTIMNGEIVYRRNLRALLTEWSLGL